MVFKHLTRINTCIPQLILIALNHKKMKIKPTLKSIMLPYLLLVITGCLHLNIYADVYGPSASVLRFQKQMAKRGNAESQYKLGLMYETGSGVSNSLVLATSWYKKAARQNYKPAVNRLTYLEIKKSGFNNSHREWLLELKADARYQEGEALFLLGQMYSEGTGVNKSLTHALELLREAAGGNIPGSEAEILRVEKELTLLQNKYNHKKIKTKTASKKVSHSQKSVHTRPKKSPAPTATASNIKKTPDLLTSKTKKVIKQPTAKKTSLSKPVTEQAQSVSIKKAQHPMDTICGGRNRYTRDCR